MTPSQWMDELAAGGFDVAEAQAALLRAGEVVSGSGCWAWDLQSDRILWSENTYRIHGIDPDAAEGTVIDLFDNVHPEDRQHFEQLVDRARQSDAPSEFAYRIVRHDGSVRFLQVVIATDLTGPAGRLLVGWLRDLTETRNAERQIAAHLAVTTALGAWRELPSGARRLLAELCAALGFTRGTLWLPAGPVLEPAAVWHADPDQDAGAVPPELAVAPGDGMVGAAWSSRQPVNAPSTVTIPVLSGDDVLAVIELDGQDELDLPDRLIATLRGIGHEVGAFLSHRRGELSPAVLSDREVELLQLAADGLSGPEIARRLSLSPATVKTHFENIYARYGVPDRVAAVARALRQGVIR
jgi:PAS domain S-box-containing protein